MFNERILKLRSDMGLSQRAFAKRLDVSRQTVVRMERGEVPGRRVLQGVMRISLETESPITSEEMGVLLYKALVA